MTLFVDLRATPNGGICAQEASVWDDGDVSLSLDDFAERVTGRDVLLAAHGFNVDRDAGITTLSSWSQACTLPESTLFVGVLWPGDSRYLPILDYPIEGPEAISSGKLLASLLNRYACNAASVSFVSHSLGARTVLEALRWLDGKARRLILMAPAIENDCLTNEYADAAAKASEIYILASRSDLVLELAFPAGNLVGEIIMRGDPYDRTALGREGPSKQIPSDQSGGVWQIPDGWNYGHLDYLPNGPIGRMFMPPVADPVGSAPVPSSLPAAEWKPSWSAGAVSTQAT